MAAAIDGGDMEGVGEPVERDRTRQRNDMAAIDQAAAEAAFALDELVEGDARGVLIKPRRDHVLGFLDGIAVDMIDLLADGIIPEFGGAAGEREVIIDNVVRRPG